MARRLLKVDLPTGSGSGTVGSDEVVPVILQSGRMRKQPQRLKVCTNLTVCIVKYGLKNDMLSGECLNELTWGNCEKVSLDAGSLQGLLNVI